MDDAFEMVERHSATYERRASDLAKQYGGGKTISVSQAARMLSVSRWTVNNMIKNGVLIAFAPGGRNWRLFKAQVQDYLIYLQKESIEYSAASSTKKAWHE